MSLYYDLVINCDLREDTPGEYIEAIKYLTQQDYVLTSKPNLIYPGQGNLWDNFYEGTFLAPDPDHDVISNFRRSYRTRIPTENNREVYRYRLQYCGTYIHDDYWAHCHIPFIYWLATIVDDQLIGYSRETDNYASRVYYFIVERGKLKESAF